MGHFNECFQRDGMRRMWRHGRRGKGERQSSEIYRFFTAFPFLNIKKTCPPEDLQKGTTYVITSLITQVVKFHRSNNNMDYPTWSFISKHPKRNQKPPQKSHYIPSPAFSTPWTVKQISSLSYLGTGNNITTSETISYVVVSWEKCTSLWISRNLLTVQAWNLIGKKRK